MPFLSRKKGENECRKYFKINLHERILLDQTGIEPVTGDYLTEPKRSASSVKSLLAQFHGKIRIKSLLITCTFMQIFCLTHCSLETHKG